MNKYAMKTSKLLQFLIILCFFLALAIFPLSSQGYLHRQGKYIYDGNGNEVILKGIGTGNWMIQEGYMMQTSNVAGTQHEIRDLLVETIGEERTDSFYNVWLDSHFRRIDVDSMKSWGFNSVRVAMHYVWFTPPIQDEPVQGEITWLDKGFTLIDSLLDWCGDNEMYLILDLHGAPGGQGKEASISDYDPEFPSLWESQANKDKTIALWRKLAERYSNEPWMGGYDLINETNWTFTEGNNSKLKELMVDITDAIREVDSVHIIFIEGNSFATDFSGLTPAWDDNLVYSFHKYWNENTQNSINYMINLRNTYNVPVWLGESGENSNTWFTSCIALCEKNHIGWSWWPVKKPGINNPLFVTVNEDYTDLISDWSNSAAKPNPDEAFAAVLKFAENHRLENCIYHKDVVDAMIRQPQTIETKPFSSFTSGSPVFAADYDMGRNNYAYFDKDTINISGGQTVWNQGYEYRNDGVDIETCMDNEASNGYNVGWTETGEWMEYTVDVDSTAAYTLGVRSASGSGGSKIHLESGGTAITPVITLPGTGGWQTWTTTEIQEVLLTKGIQKIKLVFDQGGSNLNYFIFSDPVSPEEINLQALYAETSIDGKFLFITLNKPVTSNISSTQTDEFTVSINNVPVGITGIALSGSKSDILKLSLAETLYYGGVIKVSYQGSSVFSGETSLEIFSNLAVTNLLPVRFNILSRIQAEDYSFNKGMESEECSDNGEGLDMGHANAGDYLDYFIYVPLSKYYNLNFRIASNVSGAQIIIRKIDTDVSTDLDTLKILSTGGWQSWITMTFNTFLEEGRYTLRLYVRNGEFNINWLQAVGTSGVGLRNWGPDDIRIYPNPANGRVYIDLGTMNIASEVLLYDATGCCMERFQSKAGEVLDISTTGLQKGLYYLKICNSKYLSRTTKLLIL